MTNERIVFTNPDGSCGIIIPTGEIPTSVLMTKDVPADATNIRQITIDELPADRLFRSAWDDSNPENFVGVNLTKARDICHNMRRDDRSKKLAPLDAEFTFVTTTTARKTAINAERNTILDSNAALQVDIDNASDEASLRAVLTGAGLA